MTFGDKDAEDRAYLRLLRRQLREGTATRFPKHTQLHGAGATKLG